MDPTWWTPLLDEARQALACGDRTMAARTARRMLDCEDLPARAEWEARSIEISSVPQLEELCPSTRIGHLAVEVDPGWSRTDPSIAADPTGGARCIVRMSNHRLVDGRPELLAGSGGIVRNRHLLCELTEDLELSWSIEIDDRCALRGGFGMVQGFEDVQLFRSDDGWSALATISEATPEGEPRVARLELDDDGTVHSASLLDSTLPHRSEQRWMPVADGVGARAVYLGDDIMIMDVSTPHAAVLDRHPAPLLLRTLQGGSQVVPIGDRWVAVVHDQWVWPGGRRSFVHRFVELNEQLHIVAVSSPFSFLQEGVERCTGAASIAGQLVLTAGVADHEALIVAIEPAEALATLESLGSDIGGVD